VLVSSSVIISVLLASGITGSSIMIDLRDWVLAVGRVFWFDLGVVSIVKAIERRLAAR